MEWHSLDGNKSVSEIVTKNCSVVTHYGYAPFGAVVVQSGKSALTNPWRFSSEFADDDTKTTFGDCPHAVIMVLCHYGIVRCQFHNGSFPQFHNFIIAMSHAALSGDCY